MTICEVIKKSKIERKSVKLQIPRKSHIAVLWQVNCSQEKVKKKSCNSPAKLVRVTIMGAAFLGNFNRITRMGSIIGVYNWSQK